jgi:hypothetical protein
MRIIILNKYIRVLPEKKSVTRGWGGVWKSLYSKKKTQKHHPYNFTYFSINFDKVL